MSADWPYLEFEVELLDEDDVALRPRVWRRFQLRRTADFAALAETLVDVCVWEEGYESEFELDGEPVDSDEPITRVGEVGASLSWTYVGYWKHRIECMGAGEWKEPHWQQFVDGARAFPSSEMADIEEFRAATESTHPGWDPDAVQLRYILRLCEHSGDELDRTRRNLRKQLPRLRAGLPARFAEEWYLHETGKELSLSEDAEGAVARVTPCDRLNCTCRSVCISTEEDGKAWINVDSGELNIDGTWSPDASLLRGRHSGAFLEELAALLVRARGEDIVPGSLRPEPLTNENMVTHHEFFQTARSDDYVVDGKLFRAWDFHCSNPDCRGCDVGVTFAGDDNEFVGEVHVSIRGRSRPRLEPASRKQHRRLKKLWIAFIRRHGDPKKHLKERNRQINEAARSYAARRGWIMP